MMLVDVVLAIIWTGVTAYAIFGGADFGAGILDLFAGSATRGREMRRQLEHSIGPVWEANHVWLIFVLVYLWTAFPTAFVSIMTTLYIPVMLAGLGIVMRGSAFAFRKWAPTLSKERVMGAAFAASSFVTPFFLGAVAGGVASGRVRKDACEVEEPPALRLGRGSPGRSIARAPSAVRSCRRPTPPR